MSRRLLLVFSAGSILPIAAAAQVNKDGLASAKATSTLVSRSTRTGASLELKGSVVHSTRSSIIRHRLIPMTGSATVVAAWEETGRGELTSYFGISLDGRTFSQVLATDNLIRTRYATFDPRAGFPHIPPMLKATAENELYFVQFVSTPLDEMRQDVAAAGGVVEGYLPENVHLVRMTTEVSERVSALPHVRWVGACDPAFRMSHEVIETVLNGSPDALAERYSIACLRDGPVQQNAVADTIRAMGGVVDHTTPDQFRMEATLTPAQVLAVARRNEVGFIDPWGGPGGTDMDIVRQVGGAAPILSTAGFLGQGVRGEVFDTEVSSNHPEWNGQAPLIHGADGNSGTHGSSCYGINFSTGVADAGATGLLPQREQGIFSWYTRCSQFTPGEPSRLSLNLEATSLIHPYKSSYQTSSVGSTQVSDYTTISQEVDDYLFKIDYLSCQSQSNTGNNNSRPQAWAKNIVSVGGVDHQNTLTRADDILSGASYGPAQDGRVKPDLWHFYENIYTTTSGSGYTQFSGTSGATPITAGHFGLLMQMWHEGVWPGFGGGSSVFMSRPYSTTAKAMITNGAFRYGPLATYPRSHQGWGMADLGYLFNIRAKTFIVNADQPLLNGQTRAYSITVAPDEPELRVTMCYIDPAPLALSLPNRVNDISLKVTSPTAVVYWGNGGLGASNASDAGGSANTVDTVENVFIPSPGAGTWTVEVIGTTIVRDAYPVGKPTLVPSGPTDAAFSLVVTGGVPAAACYADCDGVGGITANDFACFLGRFAAGESYADCDGVGGLTANDFACFLNAATTGCS